LIPVASAYQANSMPAAMQAATTARPSWTARLRCQAIGSARHSSSQANRPEKNTGSDTFDFDWMK
jgi:hypothetical protein